MFGSKKTIQQKHILPNFFLKKPRMVLIFLYSLLFDILICIWGMLIPIFYSKVFINKDQKLADIGAKNWARLSIWMLDKICGVKYEIRGLENLPRENGFIIACKHQSMWETIVMHLIFDRPVYAFKKELLRIPFYGWYIKIMSGIVVDRRGGAKSLKHLLSESKKYLANKQNIIIFPQGTRTTLNSTSEDYPYQPGIVALYSSLNATVVPAALNSGVFWPKDKISKKAGTIIIEFLPAIKPGLGKKEFLLKLENEIESKKF